MAEPFLSLNRRERADILRTVAANSGRSAVILEKDIWVCWVLQALCPGQRGSTTSTQNGVELSPQRPESLGARSSRDLPTLDTMEDDALSALAVETYFVLLISIQRGLTSSMFMVPTYKLIVVGQRAGPWGLDRARDLIRGIFWLRILEREGAEDDPEKET